MTEILTTSALEVAIKTMPTNAPFLTPCPCLPPIAGAGGRGSPKKLSQSAKSASRNSVKRMAKDKYPQVLRFFTVLLYSALRSPALGLRLHLLLLQRTALLPKCRNFCFQLFSALVGV